MIPVTPLYGLMVEFVSPEEVLHAARSAYQAGYRRMDAYTPYPVEGLSEELGEARNRVPFVVLVGGLVGAASGFFMQWWTMGYDYPLNVGGRPLNSWPLWIPITFELMVLIASFAAIFGMFFLNRLPEPYHPVFNVPGFDRASQDRFFLCIEALDPRFDRQATQQFLEGLRPAGPVMEVPN